MPKIRILHFSDIHWSPKNEDDVKTVTDAMIADLVSLDELGELNIDFAIFTGDLVLAGEYAAHFQMAWDAVVIPILQAAKIPSDRIYICPGNHDVERKKVRESSYLEDGLKSNLTTVDSVNKFVKGLDDEEKASVDAIDRMGNFYSFASQALPKEHTKSGNVVIHHVQLQGIKIGIACFDNSWRSTGESGGVDRNKLLMGERNVDFAIQNMEDTDLSIALFHHPVTWLADFDATAVAPRLYRGFDLLAFGHVHMMEPEVRSSISGTSVMSQSGALYAGRKHYNGYQILEIDTQVCKMEVNLRTYFDHPMRRFGAAENILPFGKGEFSFSPVRGNASPALEAFLREVRPTIRKLALNQLNIADLGAELTADPHGAFICPPIYLKPNKEIDTPDATQDNIEVQENDQEGTVEPSTDLEAEQPKEIEMEITEFLVGSDSLLLSGGREVGKTSLAHFIATLISEGTCDKVRIPIIVDFRKFKPTLYSLKKEAANYLGISKQGFDLESALADGDLFIIVDNYSGHDSKTKSSYQEFLKTNPNNRWLLLADTRYGSTNPSTPDNDLIEGFRIANIRTLPRKSIRELSRRWSDRMGLDKEKTFSMVMRQIETNGLPRTGYIVTLLLWAMKHSAKNDRLNEAVLLMNMADFLLGKADFRITLESDFDPTSKEITLQAFANFLRSSGDFIHPNDAVKFLIDFFKSKGLNHDAARILDTLCTCGILSKSPDAVGFKYRCFQEYFLAGYIGSSDARLKEALFSRKYLGSMREFELLSGLSRENDSIIDELTLQITKFGPPEISGIELSSFDRVVDEESSINMSRKKLKKIREKKITASQIDDLMDSAEAVIAERTAKKGDSIKKDVSPKQNQRTASEDGNSDAASLDEATVERLLPKLNPANYMATVELLGRVLRNSEFTDKRKKIDGVRLYLQSNARIFLKLIDLIGALFHKFAESISEEGEEFDDESRRALTYILTKRLMSVVNMKHKDEIASGKLIPVFDEVLNSDDITFAERTFLTALQLHCGRKDWGSHWIKLAKDSKNRRLAVEFLTDSLYFHIHTKALSPDEQKTVEKVTWEVERALDQDNKLSKDKFLQSVRRATRKTAKSVSDLD
ncbi:MAG: metallophosphoesterase [Paracoccaceae bacterium]